MRLIWLVCQRCTHHDERKDYQSPLVLQLVWCEAEHTDCCDLKKEFLQFLPAFLLFNHACKSQQICNFKENLYGNCLEDYFPIIGLAAIDCYW